MATPRRSMRACWAAHRAVAATTSASASARARSASSSSACWVATLSSRTTRAACSSASWATSVSTSRSTSPRWADLLELALGVDGVAGVRSVRRPRRQERGGCAERHHHYGLRRRRRVGVMSSPGSYVSRLHPNAARASGKVIESTAPCHQGATKLTSPWWAAGCRSVAVHRPVPSLARQVVQAVVGRAWP